MNFSIEIKNLFKSYKNKAVINNVSFGVKPGICGLIGPSGVGKSTILNSLMGLVIPTKGEIIIENQLIKKTPYFIQNLGFAPLAFYDRNRLFISLLKKIQQKRF